MPLHATHPLKEVEEREVGRRPRLQPHILLLKRLQLVDGRGKVIVRHVLQRLADGQLRGGGWVVALQPLQHPVVPRHPRLHLQLGCYELGRVDDEPQRRLLPRLQLLSQRVSRELQLRRRRYHILLIGLGLLAVLVLIRLRQGHLQQRLEAAFHELHVPQRIVTDQQVEPRLQVCPGGSAACGVCVKWEAGQARMQAQPHLAPLPSPPRMPRWPLGTGPSAPAPGQCSAVSWSAGPCWWPGPVPCGTSSPPAQAQTAADTRTQMHKHA